MFTKVVKSDSVSRTMESGFTKSIRVGLFSRITGVIVLYQEKVENLFSDREIMLKTEQDLTHNQFYRA